MTLHVRHGLILVLVLYVAGAVLHLLATPVMEAWDEPWHYPVVQYISSNQLALPVQQPGVETPWGQQGSQPPLYYLTAGLLTSWIDTSDMMTLRRVNPHAAIGVVQPDGNHNLFVHSADLQAFPWQGTTLAVQLARLLSVVFGALTIVVSYQLGRELFPDRPVVAIGAAAFTGLLPMFVFIQASVSNDSLANLLGNALTLTVVRMLSPQRQTGIRQYLLLGLLTGAGLLTKLSLAFFIPIIVTALAVLSLRQRDWRPFVIGGAVSGGVTILIAGWWYLRNLQLYGEPTGLSVFLDIVGRRATPTFAQLWSERFSFTRSYWGAYGAFNIVLPDALYLVFDLIAILAMIGVVLLLIRRATLRDWPTYRWLQATVTLVWPIIAFVSLLRWTSDTFGSQGRLIFISLSALSIWMAAGLSAWLPRRFGSLPVIGASGFMAVVMLSAPILIIAPAYAAPEALPTRSVQVLFEHSDGSGIGLTGAGVLTEQAEPGQQVDLWLDWQIERQPTRNWSLFVHLFTEEDVLVAQRDVYPGGGRLATSDLSPGKGWHNPASVLLPRNLYSPNRLAVRVGWYDVNSGERMQITDGAVIDAVPDAFTIGTIEVLPRASTVDVPNPLHVNFGGLIELVGYALSALSAEPGEDMTLTLYWRALRPVHNDYVVFANIIDSESLTKYAASNAMPANWTRPTSSWAVGEIVEDRHGLAVFPDALPGIYEIEVGLYLQQDDGGFSRLRIVPQAGELDNDFATLSRVRIFPQEDGS